MDHDIRRLRWLVRVLQSWYVRGLAGGSAAIDALGISRHAGRKWHIHVDFDESADLRAARVSR